MLPAWYLPQSASIADKSRKQWSTFCGGAHAGRSTRELGPGHEIVDAQGWEPITKATGLFKVPQHRMNRSQADWFSPGQETQLWEKVTNPPEIHQAPYRTIYTDGSGKYTRLD